MQTKVKSAEKIEKPNYDHIKPPHITTKLKTKKELENQEHGL